MPVSTTVFVSEEIKLFQPCGHVSAVRGPLGPGQEHQAPGSGEEQGPAPEVCATGHLVVAQQPHSPNSPGQPPAAGSGGRRVQAQLRWGPARARALPSPPGKPPPPGAGPRPSGRRRAPSRSLTCPPPAHCPPPSKPPETPPTPGFSELISLIRRHSSLQNDSLTRDQTRSTEGGRCQAGGGGCTRVLPVGTKGAPGGALAMGGWAGSAAPPGGEASRKQQITFLDGGGGCQVAGQAAVRDPGLGAWGTRPLSPVTRSASLWPHRCLLPCVLPPLWAPGPACCRGPLRPTPTSSPSAPTRTPARLTQPPAQAGGPLADTLSPSPPLPEEPCGPRRHPGTWPLSGK